MLNRLSLNRIGLNRIGLNRIGKPSGGSSDRPYIDPKVLDSLCGVWIMDQNTNESESRNIIKNKIADRGGDLELLNFAYKANSGYNGYPEDFTSWNYNSGLIVSPTKFQNNGDAGRQLIYYHTSIRKEDVLEFKVKITLDEQSKIKYWYIKEDGTGTSITYSKSGTYTIPTSYFSKYTGENTWFGFEQLSGGCIIEQPPLYEGALVTDGKDDMIVSQKTVQEMGVTNEITVVSMIHQIGIRSEYNRAFNNYIRNQNVGFIRNNIAGVGIDKTGIYGYTWNNSTKSVINNILGDKNDYSIEVGVSVSIEGKFTVEGYINNGSPDEISEVAVYWTFIANKVLTTDDINQIIAYFKLDKYVTPQVIYDVKRQGLTNDTPAADWYLKDFSGNGHDMQLYNYAKSKDSGIGKYELDFNEFTTNTNINTVLIEKNKDTFYAENLVNSSTFLIYKTIQANNTLTDTPSFKAKVEINKGTTLQYRYINSDGVQSFFNITEEGEHEFPISYNNRYVNSVGVATNGFVLNRKNTCRITQIPDYEGALVSDGKDDYGHADNLPIFKDYTVAIDRAWISDLSGKYQCLASKINEGEFGAFNVELTASNGTAQSFSFGRNSGINIGNINRKIIYQSKYSYNGSTINAGANVDGKDLFLFKNRDSYPYYAEAAVWSYLLFPYSLSEFLLERQLKKYKLGTLYPDMVEFRPIIKSNIDIDKYYFINKTTNKQLNIGDYFAITDTIEIQIYLTDEERQEIASLTVNGKEFTPTFTGIRYLYHIENFGELIGKKSPQKIDITIDEYIRYEDIVQPYPGIANLKQGDKVISYGDKLKVGSKVTFAGVTNILSELYAAGNEIQYNGTVISPNNSIVVDKSMAFTNAHTWKLTTTEPLAIYSPQKLTIPNSSLKILGYVPDLTGKGNHGKLNNFAYALNSGANGYAENYFVWKTANTNVVITDSKIKATGKLTHNFIAYTTASINKHKIKITGIPNGDTLRYSYRLDGVGKDFYIVEDGVYDIPASDAFSSGSGFLINNLSSYNWSNVIIEQIGEHEGSICFDGTDDHITIPTLTHGGKCVMMKVNWEHNNVILYDQRVANTDNFALSVWGDVAYNYRNSGSTYIDGILNTNIAVGELQGIIHNITATNSLVDGNTTSPILGKESIDNRYYANMSLYEFMLFPEIPSEDEIKKLNDVMGIEGGYVESPNYYWDAYGKKNTDADRNLIADQVSKDVANALEVKNFAYNSESGYGYGKSNFISVMESNQTFVDIIDDYNFIIKATPHNNNQFFAQVNTPKLIPNNYIRFKVSGIPEDFKMVFGYDYVEGGTNKYSHIIDKNGVYSYDSFNVFYTSFRAYTGYTDLTGLNIKVEFLDYHPNGLLSDGVDDYLINTVIPAVTDFTVIAKREWLDKDSIGNECFIHKGAINTPIGETAFILEYEIANDVYYRSSSYGGYINIERTNRPEKIVYQTPISYNGTTINKGSGTDTIGLILGTTTNNYWKGVFYKMMLYTKTIDQLSINMLKNLFEIDELINVTNPIFKKQ